MFIYFIDSYHYLRWNDKVIKTTEYKRIPATIMHQITGEIDVEETKRGINDANEVINKVIHKYGMFNLIIDLRGISFTDLAAHKAWKIWSQNRLFKEKVNYIAFVLVDSSHTRAEKELMETDTVQFFFDFNEGSNWLQKKGRT